MTVYLHEEDLPDRRASRPAPSPSIPKPWGSCRAATGCAWCRFHDGRAMSISFVSPPAAHYAAPNLKAVLADPARAEALSFRALRPRRDPAYLGVMAAPVYCTKIASRLVRTYTDRHGLKDLVREAAWA